MYLKDELGSKFILRGYRIPHSRRPCSKKFNTSLKQPSAGHSLLLLGVDLPVDGLLQVQMRLLVQQRVDDVEAGILLRGCGHQNVVFSYGLGGQLSTLGRLLLGQAVLEAAQRGSGDSSHCHCCVQLRE